MRYSRTVLVCTCCVFLGLGCQTRLPLDMGRVTGTRLSDEDKITLVLEDVQRGMQRRRIYQVLAHVSRNYEDREGRDYQQLSEDLNTIFRHYRAINITRTPPDIRVRGDRARVIDTFGTIAESVLPLEYPPTNLQGQVVIMLDRFGDTWQIVEWGPIS